MNVAEFLRAALVPREDSGYGSHAGGSLTEANQILAAHPEIARASVYTAATLGDDGAVREFLARDAGLTTAKGGPYEWDAITHLCFSRYLRLDKARSDGFVRAADMLLEAGADANSGFYEVSHAPEPAWEPVLYGAAGVAHHPGVTALLLAHGANPSDGEVVYHAPESYDNDALKLIVATGKLSAEDLALMLVRKHDWHDYEGAKWLLEHGAKPDYRRDRGFCPLHHALERDNHIRMIELLLDHGADPLLVTRNGRNAVQIAAWYGRSDALELFERRGYSIQLEGLDGLVAACARDDARAVRDISAREPRLIGQLIERSPALLREFAGTGNQEGVRQLLDLGVPVDTSIEVGGYWGYAKGATALHVAAWRLQHDVVKLLVQRGANVNARDGEGRTPLTLLVRASVDSYWSELRSPESVAVLIAAGAAKQDVPYPSGYADADELLAS